MFFSDVPLRHVPVLLILCRWLTLLLSSVEREREDDTEGERRRLRLREASAEASSRTRSRKCARTVLSSVRLDISSRRNVKVLSSWKEAQVLRNVGSPALSIPRRRGTSRDAALAPTKGEHALVKDR